MSAADHLGELLAAIHGDGGHHTRTHGLARSASDAHAVLAALFRERDAAQSATIDAALIHADLVRERDEARAEVERLRHERRQLRARLVECRPWVGVCPFPNQPGFSEMLAIRDLADDTLDEVKS